MNRISLKLARLRSWACVALALASWLPLGTVVTSAQATDPTVLPVVSLKPVASETTEPSITSKIAPARFLVQRTGDLSQILRLFLQFSGTATPGKDYVQPDSVVELAAGVASAEVMVAAVDDDLVEGPETVVVQLMYPVTDNIPNYIIDPNADILRLLIRDNDEPGTLRPPVVGLETLVASTSEPNPLALIAPGTVRLNRTGSTVDALRVGMMAHGTATPGKDYEIRLRGMDQPLEIGTGGVTIVPLAAGEASVTLFVLGLADELSEGDETIVFTLLPSMDLSPTGAYLIDAQAMVAKLVLHDMDLPAAPSIEITQPRDGEIFAPGAPIQIQATAIDPRGYIAHVDFYAGAEKIGESTLNFFVAPEPGTPIHHSFTWHNAPAGTHALTVQTALADGSRVQSRPVNIVVQREPVTSTVSISAPSWRTAEPIPGVLMIPGILRVERTPPLRSALRVFLSYDGTATADSDYRSLPESVEIPVGQSAVEVRVFATADDLVEGPEILRARIVESPLVSILPSYLISADANQALIAITDQDKGGPETRLDLIEPHEGQEFVAGATINLVALGVTTAGEIDRGVEFYADEKLIGKVEPLPLGRPTIPGLPSSHSIVWKDVPAGRYVLTARTTLPSGLPIVSPGIRIVVGDVALPQVSITYLATPDAFVNADYAPGLFRIERTGPTERALGVFVKKGGTAIPGVDYEDFSALVWIPAGQSAVNIKIQAIDDKLPETQESVSLTLIQPPADAVEPVLPRYLINPNKASAELLMFDNDRVSEIASLEMASPRDGEQFGFGSEVRIVVVAIDKLADIRRVEFFDGNNLIGVSVHLTKDAVIPGRPREHVFVWKGASVGTHELWACALDSEGATVLSKRVQIRVSELPPRVALSVVAKDPLAKENGLNGETPDPAVFTIRRVAGPLDVEVMVHYALGGVAANGVDYEKLSGHVILPSGAESVDVVVTPIPDKALEGDEGVVLELEAPICPAIFPPLPQCYLIVDPSSARAVIQDSKPSDNQAPSIAITKPVTGSSFEFDQNIQLVAEGRDSDGFISRVEFFSGRVKIGEVNVPRPLPNTPVRGQVFRFIWKDAEAGKHTLIARATDTEGATTISSPVEISVAPNHPRPIVTVLAWDAHAVEPTRPGELNTASFQIRRSGSTTDPLTVFYSLGGTATEGRDYESIPHQVIIPSGRSSVFVTITPVDDSERERTESVVIQLEDSPAAGPVPPYTVGRPANARAVIADAGWILPAGNAHCVELPGGLTHLCFPGADGSRFRVEASDDLLSWETVLHVTAIDGACHFVDDTLLEHGHRFYRAVPLPAAEDPLVP